MHGAGCGTAARVAFMRELSPSRPADLRIACFGEILLRLAAPGHELLLQSHSLQQAVAGAEANVAVSLALFGQPVGMVTVLPDNALGSWCAGELRRHGVDTGGVRPGPGRMGLYFVEHGAGHRPTRIIYDRDGSAFELSLADHGRLLHCLPRAEWLHISGVTAGLGPAAAHALLAIARAAHDRGMRLSFDCNYRESLWKRWHGDAGEVFRQIAAWCEVLFAGPRDFALMFGEGRPPGETDRCGEFASGALTALSRFEQLRLVATTMHEQCGAEQLTLSGLMMSRDGMCATPTYPLGQVVERIGNGDAFAAGVLHAVLGGHDAQRAVEFGAAAACLKHSIAGDANLATAADVDRLMRGETTMRR